MDKKQKQALACLEEIERFAKEQKLSMRILDSIDECKQQITAKNIKWDEVNFAVEDILKSIESKTAPVSVYVDKNENEISIQAIKAQISKMAERCHAENESSMGMMTERKNVILKKAYSEIQEISHTGAHSRELKSDEFYLEFFKKMKRKYEDSVFQMIREMLADISNNYNYMLEHMKSMFQSIGGYAAGVGNETFYHEYVEKKEGLDKKIQSETESSEVGGSDIVSFGIRTKDAMKDIRKKMNRKAKLFMWAPVLLVMAVLVISFSVKTITSVSQNKAAVEREEEKENSEANDHTDNASEEKAKLEELIEISKSIEKIGDLGNSGIDSGIKQIIPNVKPVLIAAAVIIVLYAAYIIMLKLWCNQQIRKRCGEYLKTETLQFEQSNTLMTKLDAVMRNSAEEYERQYLAILNAIFLGTNYDLNNAENEKTDQFTELKEKWNALRYE